MVHDTMCRKLLDALPHGYNLAEEDWQRRHRLMLWLLGAHIPALAVFGLALGHTPRTMVLVSITPLVAVTLGYLLRNHRRTASVAVTGGLVYCSAALVGLTHGAIEAHFHFFVLVGFIALYQDWAPFACYVIFTLLSHGIGAEWQQGLIFDHAAGQSNPWLWSLIHGLAVVAAWVGMIFFWRITEDSQRDKDLLVRRLADAEINRRQFTSDLLTNLARRNQRLLHRQLEIINQLEDSEEDPDALAELFALDHIATRVRRNAESLLVLSGEQAPRTWSEPVPLRDVLRAAIAETENLERVVFVVDEQSAVVGHTVTDLTHLLAELTENAVRFSPPDTTVTVRARPDRARPGGRLITIEDWGLGMPADKIEEANTLLASPPEIDFSVSQRLGFHVVARLAARHGIRVALNVTPGSGTTALVTLPPSLFAPLHPTTTIGTHGGRRTVEARSTTQVVPVDTTPAAPQAAQVQGPRDGSWTGWWDPAIASALPAFNPAPAAITGAAVGAVPAATMPTYRTSTSTGRSTPPPSVSSNGHSSADGHTPLSAAPDDRAPRTSTGQGYAKPNGHAAPLGACLDDQAPRTTTNGYASPPGNSANGTSPDGGAPHRDAPHGIPSSGSGPSGTASACRPSTGSAPTDGPPAGSTPTGSAHRRLHRQRAHT